MEFEELRKVWDTQNNEPMYVINESALYKSVTSKKEKGLKITNISELLSIIVHLGASAFILLSTILDRSSNIYMYILAGWMMMTGVYCLFGRIQRKRGDRQFDRTMLGDLNYAVSIATYQVRFSALLRWNAIPIALLTLLGVWDAVRSPWMIIILTLFFAATLFASSWEHKYYKTRRRDVEELRKILLKTG